MSDFYEWIATCLLGGYGFISENIKDMITSEEAKKVAFLMARKLVKFGEELQNGVGTSWEGFEAFLSRGYKCLLKSTCDKGEGRLFSCLATNATCSLIGSLC